MNLILLFHEDFIDSNRVLLTGRRAEHILKVHRATVGDELSVGISGGMTGKGTLVSMEKRSVMIDVSFTQNPPAPRPVTLILALPRPKVLRRVLQTATSMGVKRIFLINAYRVEKSFWSSPFLSNASIRDQLILGLEQARDTVMPEVLLRPLFKPFVEDELPDIACNTKQLVAHPGAGMECPRNVSENVTLAIGPEGGFIQFEIEKLSECGFQAVCMGERILRVEAAVPAVLSRLF